MPLDSPLVEQARELSRWAHRHQRRKASGLPYFTHLEGVAHLLAEHGYHDEVTLAAAFLHDLLEDQPAHAEAMRRQMPADVIGIVEVLSEQKLDAQGRKRPKAERFEDYVSGLSRDTPLTRRALPVSCADRIHNTRSIVEDERLGRSPLMLLTTRPGELEAQHDRLRELYAPVVRPELLAAFDRARDDLGKTINRWLPGRAAMIAASEHLGRFDETGEPSIFHPLRLALEAAMPEERIVALLHDVPQDANMSLDQLRREGFRAGTLRALERLTRRPGETYDAFIDRIARDRLATRVKLLELEDSAARSRPSATGVDQARRAECLRATERLQHELAKRSLRLVLDEESRRRVASHASLPVLKARHVTLVHRVHPHDFSAEWIPGGHQVGNPVGFRATCAVHDSDLEVFGVEVAGVQTRPDTGARLYLTVSRARTERPRSAARLLERAAPSPLELELSGRIQWADD